MRIASLSIRTMLLLTVSMLTLLIAGISGQQMHGEWKRLEQIRSLKSAMYMSDQLFDAAQKLSVERDVAYSMLHAPDTQTVEALRSLLQESRASADATFTTTMAGMKQYNYAEIMAMDKKLTVQLSIIRQLREQIDREVKLPKEQQNKELSDNWLQQSTELMTIVQDVWMEFLRYYTDIDPTVTQHLRYKHHLRVIMDHTGRERALIGRLIVENAEPTPEQFSQLLRGQGIIDISWRNGEVIAKQSRLYTVLAPYYMEARSHYLNLYDMVRDIFYIPPGARKVAAYPISIGLWFELSEQVADSLSILKDQSLQEASLYVETLETNAERSILLHLTLLVFALLLCGCSYWVIINRVSRPITMMVEALISASEGNAPAIRPVINPHDEIGKLAGVLYALQENMEKIRLTSVMLENYTHALERSNKELDDFAYIASHDLKEPLRGLFNHATFLLEDYADKLDEQGVHKLKRLSYLSQRMETLVNDLLYFSRLGRQELAIQSTDMNAVIHDIENTLDVFLHERGARIIVPKPLPTVTCDKPRVTEVFRNLITNAAKYNDRAEKTVEIGFLPTHPSPEGETMRDVFYVKDDGRGIAREFYDEIFRIFKRLQNNKSNEEGTGAGLTFVKKIIDRHGGRIWLESEPGSGTTFYFTLKA